MLTGAVALDGYCRVFALDTAVGLVSSGTAQLLIKK